jgi:uncharacterized protein YjiS (DUF1127 family)
MPMDAECREPGQRPGPWFALSAALTKRIRPVAEAVGIWVERRRMRRRLSHLSDHMLKDIGISRTDRAQEAEKPFWQK